MPSIGEPTWRSLKERREQCVRDFHAAIPGTVSYSPDVLAARLFGLGLRGQDLKAEVRLAEMERLRATRRIPNHEEERHAHSLSLVTQLMKRKDN